MAAKQSSGLLAPDGSTYVTVVDGAGNLNPSTTANANGQATMTNSAPVVIASNQSAVPVSQSGTWTIQPGNTANTTAWKVDGSAVTQPVTQALSATGGASFLRIAAGQATTVVKATAGTLYAITLNSAAAVTNITVVYDNATGVGTVIAAPAVTTATVPTTLSFGPGLAFANGLTIITAVANGGDMTIVFK